MDQITIPMLTLGLSLLPILCWGATPNAQQAATIAEIERRGGKVYVWADGNRYTTDNPSISVDFNGNAGNTDSMLVSLKRLSQLNGLILAETNVTDAGLEHLQVLTKLR